MRADPDKKAAGRFYGRVTLSMVDEDVVRAFAKAVGVGRVLGPYLNKATGNYFWTWQTGGWAATRYLHELFQPYLGERRLEQFVNALTVAHEPIYAWAAARASAAIPRLPRRAIVGVTVPEERAWAAGLFEAEGTCGAYVKTDTRRTLASPRAAMNLNDQDVLERFVRVVGVGALYGPYRRKSGSTYWSWQATGWDALKELKQFLGPYLFSRRTEQLDAVLRQEPGDHSPVVGHVHRGRWIEPHDRKRRRPK